MKHVLYKKTRGSTPSAMHFVEYPKVNREERPNGTGYTVCRSFLNKTRFYVTSAAVVGNTNLG